MRIFVSQVGLIGRNEIVGKQTADEFSSQFGSGSCVFYKCDVTQTEELKGKGHISVFPILNLNIRLIQLIRSLLIRFSKIKHFGEI